MCVWALVGAAVASAIVLTTDVDAGPAFRLSILFAVVVGLTAYTSARLVFPLLARLPYAVRIMLEVLTVLSGTIFGSVAILALQPLFALSKLPIVALIVAANGTIAVVVGIALNTYDGMRRQIEDSFRVLQAKEAMERELVIARDVQRELLPRSVPQLAGLELAGVCLPAAGVAGDYYDFLLLEQHVGLVVADVSGKGISAALLMAGLQASVRSLCRPAFTPAQLNEQLNQILLQSSAPARYATFFLGFYNVDTRVLTYSNAGHPPPIIVGSRGLRRLSTGGLPLGLFEGRPYDEGREQLEAGDLLALFTDGVIEAPNAKGEEFGESQLLQLLERVQSRPLEAALGAVLEAVGRWSETFEAHDDITLVLARVPRHGSPGNQEDGT